ncbi:MAG TPA: cytochrome c oxidase subunit 3 [Aliidongia sp.]|uniref:cytochrome c oxidase subunit 3 n=1 Tax=Aliidongia sp. TaxID=1914230 RepID=UPI002DDC91EC|nr:cytochrome c oxidase subunit 3 [Aliidongia sp.]HEV2673242.1 cytochrome c oxidase subunit 3 [Aliidongia sp.]
MAEIRAGHPAVGMQYEDLRHQSDTALVGMWLFLATEILFFGALLFAYMVYRLWYPAGFVAAVRHANVLIGTINTAILLTSSFTLTAGLLLARVGDMRRLVWACLATMALGLAFIGLKAVEYVEDFHEHLVPGAGFALAETPGAQIFYLFYYSATGIHLVHLAIGIGLVAYIVRRTRRGDFSARYHTPAEVVGLYWSFVDIVWLFLYPLIYLVGRGG